QIDVPPPACIRVGLRLEQRRDQQILANQELIVQELNLVVVEGLVVRVGQNHRSADRHAVQRVLEHPVVEQLKQAVTPFDVTLAYRQDHGVEAACFNRVDAVEVDMLIRIRL